MCRELGWPRDVTAKHSISEKGKQATVGLRGRIQVLDTSPDGGRELSVICLEKDLVFVEFQENVREGEMRPRGLGSVVPSAGGG